MEVDIYKKYNNFINIINKRYTTLIDGFTTQELNIDEIFISNN
jgi:hypothetical protein